MVVSDPGSLVSVTVQQINKALKEDLAELLKSYDDAWRVGITNQTQLLSAYRACSAINKLACLARHTDAPHRRDYLSELSADGVGVAHALLSGDLRGARFYLRSAIENLLRHLYYFDHPIEFEWTNDEQERFYIEPSALREYAARLSVFRPSAECLSELSALYSSLSGHVHTGATAGMTLRQSLADMKVTDATLAAFLPDLQLMAKNAIALLFLFHYDRVNDIDARAKRWLIDQLDQKRKKLLLNS